MAEELVGAPEAAARLGLTSERIRQLAKAGELPAAAGRLGRQDVWRWQELLDWAVAQGRLDDSAGGPRQRVRAWAPGRGRRRRVVDTVLDWDGGRSHVHVRIWEASDDTAEPPVVVIGNLEDSQGQSATNGIEEVAMLIASRYLGPAGLQAQYYDHRSRGEGGVPVFDHVVFSVGSLSRAHGRWARGANQSTAYALGNALVDPSWRATAVEEIERLVGEAVEIYTPGTYTAAMVRAVHQAGDQGVDAFWDPDGASAAGAAYQWLRQVPVGDSASSLHAVREPAMMLAAWHAVQAVRQAASDLVWQDPNAPVRLHLPELSRATELRRAADRAAHAVSHEEAWAVVGAVRERLAAVDLWSRQVLVPARGGGLCRLAWWEAGAAEPEDHRQGMTGPIVVKGDLLSAEPAERELTELELLLAVERAALCFLEGDCKAAEQWDVPVARPAGPYPTGGPAAQRYLDTVCWRRPDPGDQHRQDRLTRLLDARGGGLRSRRSAAKFGHDPAGRLVAVSRDGRWFSLEWPVGAGNDLLQQGGGLLDATVTADQDREHGAQPVWVEFAEGPLVPLPARAGWGSAHEFTWGYSGTGPGNLTAAIVELVLSAADDRDRLDIDALARAIHRLVRSGRTPAWRVRDLVEAAKQAS